METINGLDKELLLAKLEEAKKNLKSQLFQKLNTIESKQTTTADFKSIDDLKARMHKKTANNNAITNIPDGAKNAIMSAKNSEGIKKIREKVMQSDVYKQMEAKKNLFSNIRNYDKSSEVNEFKIGEEKLWLDKTTRASLLVRIEAERLSGKENTTFWSNGKEYVLPLDEAKSIINSLEVYASECFDNTQRHLQNAKNLTIIEDMELYDYKSGYPAKLRF